MPGPPPGGPGSPQTVTSGITQLLSQNADRYTWIAATNGAGAADYQLATDDPVMPIGGFGSFGPSPTLEQFQRYVAEHRIHYYIKSAMGPMPDPSGGHTPPTDATPNPFSANSSQTRQPTEADKIAAWVKHQFTATTIDGVTLYDLTTPNI